MHRSFLQTASVLDIISVGLGAFAAHALKQTAPPDALAIFETGVRYQFYHSFAIFIVAILYKDFPNKWMTRAGSFFIAGIILFSGSLYLLTYMKTAAIAGLKWVGPLTPIGGLCFILGWILVLVAVTSRKNSQ